MSSDSTSSNEPPTPHQHVDDPLVSVDDEWRITGLNDAAATLLGGSPSQLHGTRLWDAWPGLDGSTAATELREHGTAEPTTMRLPGPSGSTSTYRARVYPANEGLTLFAYPDESGDDTEPTSGPQYGDGHRQVLDEMDEGFCIVEVLFDDDGEPVDYRFEETNPAFEAQTGLVDVEGERIVELEPDHDDHWLAAYGTVAQTGDPVRLTEQASHLDDRWYDVYAFRIGNPDDHRVAILFHEITQRKRLEAELEGILDRVTDAFFALDDDWRFTHLNERAQELINPEGRRLVGKYVWDEFPEAVSRDFKPKYERAMREQETVTFEEYYPEPLDAWFEVSAYPSESGLSVYFRDVTGRKRREHELRRYETIFETMNDGVYTVDTDGRFTMVNREYVEMLGYDREELLGAHVSQVVDEATIEQAQALESELADSEVTAVPSIEAPLQRADGSTFPAEARFALIEGQPETERIGVVRDISDRKRRERELERRVEQQEYVADLGRRALEGEPLDDLFDDAVETVAETLDVEFCKVLDLDDDGEELALRAGVGWQAGYVGSASVGTGSESQAGYTLRSSDPVVVDDMAEETRFSGPELLTEHGVRSGVSVVIGTVEEPWGVFGTHDAAPRAYDEEDVSFVQSVANVLATAIDRQAYERRLKRYEVVTEQSTDVNAIVDPDGTITYVTPSVEEVLGYPPEEVVGENFFEYLSEEDEAAILDRLQRLLDGETSTESGELTLPRADGSEAIMAISGRDLREDPYVDGVVVYTHDVTEERRQARRLRDQRDRLEALVELNGVVRDINAAVIDSATRTELEERVCANLAAADSYAFAWIGEVDTTDGEVVARTSAGPHEDYLDAVTIPYRENQPPEGPTATALRTGEIQVLHRTAEYEHEAWRAAASDAGFGSSAAIPITYEDRQYGVLNLYSEREHAFDEQERTVISLLGESIGHAIASLERKAALIADSAVELELALPGVGTAVEAAPDGPTPTLQFDRTIPLGEGQFLLYVTATGMDESAVRTFVQQGDDDTVRRFRRIDDDDDVVLYELLLDEPPALSSLAEFGGLVREVAIQGQTAVLTVELAPESDVRQVIEAVEARYPDVSLVSQRQVTRDSQSSIEYVSAVEEQLTDRQRQALETAYFAGYYDWPRSSSASDVAEALSISDATVAQHLRSGHEKLCAALFESGDDEQ
jgi:PAS domain S-box-containing protein